MPESGGKAGGLGQITVRDIISGRNTIYGIESSASARDAAARLKELGIRATGVLEGEKLVGIVSHYDISVKVALRGRDASEVRVSEIMSPNVITVNLLRTFSECLELFEKHNISHLVVEDRKGQYHGVLSCRDLQKKMLENLELELEVTRQYAFGPHATD